MGRAAEGLLISIAGPPLERLGRAGARFTRRLADAIGERPYAYSIYAAQATDVLLDAIAASDGTRASVLRHLFAARVHDGSSEASPSRRRATRPPARSPSTASRTDGRARGT